MEFFGLQGGGAPPAPTPDRSPHNSSGAAATSSEGEEPEDGTAENPPLNLRLVLQHDHPHLTTERGLHPQTLAVFEVGYCSQGTLRSMIAIPIHRSDGALVAYAGRRLKPETIKAEGKYKFPRGFRTELELFNLHRARAHVGAGLIIVEGFFTVMKLYQLGFPNVVALMGCTASPSQIELLVRTVDDVTLLLDPDEAGTRGAEKLHAALVGRIRVRRIRLPPDTDPDALDARTARWLLNGVTALDLGEVSISRS